MRSVRRAMGVAIFVAALVIGWGFAHTNPEPVSVALPLLGSFPAQPLWLVLAAAFGAGVLVAGLAGLYQGARLSLTARRWRRQATDLEAELHQLRNLPLAAGPEAPPRGSAGSASGLERVEGSR